MEPTRLLYRLQVHAFSGFFSTKDNRGLLFFFLRKVTLSRLFESRASPTYRESGVVAEHVEAELPS